MHRSDLERLIRGASQAHRELLDDLAGLTDDQAAADSLLPSWTVGHVLTHLARNADSHVRLFAAAERGTVGEQYEGGSRGRAAEIEAGSTRGAQALVGDVGRSITALEAAWAAASAETWNGTGSTPVGLTVLHDLPLRRWRETIVHRSDLGLGYTPADWPNDYVRTDLVPMTMLWASRRSMGLTVLPAAALAAPPSVRLAWLFGRASIDGLEPAGVFG